MKVHSRARHTVSELVRPPRGTIPDALGVPIRVHYMTDDDLGSVHVPKPVETGDIILLEHGEYRVLDVIPVDDARSPLHALVRAQPAHLYQSRGPDKSTAR